jgi:hypothetical protein
VARSIEIAVAPKDLEYPPMCANCANATSESLDVAKVFRRVDTGPDANPDWFVVERAMVPFCPPCMAQHQNEVRKVTPWERLWMTCRGHNAMGVPAFAVMGLLMLFAASIRPSLIFFGLAALFGLGAWYSYRTAYNDSEHLAVPPPTSITSAFDFTDVHSRVSNREHRTLILRNDLFADALIARNPGRLWTADDQAKKDADWRRFFR